MTWRSAKGNLKKSAALIVAGVVFVCVVRAQDPDPSSGKEESPLLEVDLRKFGYDTSSATKRLRKFVDFTDSDHLALAWLTLDDPALADKTGPATARPAHLHVLVLDARTGQKIGVQAWPTPSTPVRFLAAREGKFLTCTGNMLRLFSPSFEVIREKELPNGRKCIGQRPGWGISPSRRSLLLYLFLGGGQGYEYTLLDAETFAVITSWTEKPLIENISDHWLFAFCGQKREACIRTIDKHWQTFQPNVGDKRINNSFYSARFVNDETLVMAREKMWVTSVEGSQLFQVELPKNRSFESAVTSSGGQRFVVFEDRKRGPPNEALEMYFYSNDRAVVYSVPERHAIFSVKVKGTSPWTPWENHVNQLALSSDGTLLAVITDATLRVYRLPDGQAARH